jgi:endoglycosylceramidase
VSTRTIHDAQGRGARATRRAALLAAAAITLLLALAGEAGAASLSPLHVADGQIRDAHGRQILLRGVNVTALTDQFQVNPRLPTVVPLRRRDYLRMEVLGFNVIRLAINWSKLEPERGRISGHYIGRIRKVVDKAARHGMYTVIDVHSTAWGKDTATRHEKCPGDLRRSHGGHGAPGWATFLDGETTCHDDEIHTRTPAVKQAWNNFWHNREKPNWQVGGGIQDHLISAWGALGSAFAGEPAVAGYDLLNEPDPGTTQSDQAAFSEQFHSGAIAAIRSAEAEAGGFSHMVFFEPNLTWGHSRLRGHAPAPGFSDDPNLVFAPHLYGNDAHSTSSAVKPVRQTLKKQARQVIHRARSYGAALWIGEWGFSIFDKHALKKLRVHSEIQDLNELGSAWWQWKVACGAPQTFDGLNPKPLRRPVGNLNPTECPSGKDLPRSRGWKAIIGRAYPKASPGTLTELSAHGSQISLTGESGCDARTAGIDPKACRLEVWIPKRKSNRHRPPQIDGRRLRDIVVRRSPGGWLAKADVRGDYSLSAD